MVAFLGMYGGSTQVGASENLRIWWGWGRVQNFHIILPFSPSAVLIVNVVLTLKFGFCSFGIYNFYFTSLQWSSQHFHHQLGCLWSDPGEELCMEVLARSLKWSEVKVMNFKATKTELMSKTTLTMYWWVFTLLFFSLWNLLLQGSSFLVLRCQNRNYYTQYFHTSSHYH